MSGVSLIIVIADGRAPRLRFGSRGPPGPVKAGGRRCRPSEVCRPGKAPRHPDNPLFARGARHHQGVYCQYIPLDAGGTYRRRRGQPRRGPRVPDLVGELSTRSDEFRTRWGAHNVRHHGTGTKRFHHHTVGDLTLAYEGLEMAAAPGLTLTVYTAEPCSPHEEGLRLLASWAATQNLGSPAERSAD
ncbi:hypothetical protein [Streptomyces sp. NPDC085659]|uniref:MmyB family transcriptional regulator n=1 Tax=Streptomyces sp. NPDC085659 TaxID=3155177 RepID=UPI00344B3B97